VKSYHAAATVFLVASFLAFALPSPRSYAADDYTREISPDFDNVRGPETKDPKHTPKISAPDKVKAGEWFDVTIEIGQGARHPSLIEHHVRWIALYAGDAEITRTYLHPVMSTPKVTYTIRLEKSTTLKAVEAPTHTAEWEAVHEIEVVK